MNHSKISIRLKTSISSLLYTIGTFGVLASNPSDKPNIIVVLADDQGWGDMGYNGHPVIQTPNFDEMSVSGLRLDRMYSAAPVSSPTRANILTGRHPNRFECFTWGHTLRPQETTIAERLQEAGYRTGHFGKWHVGTVYKNSPVNPSNSGFDYWVSAPNFFENDPIFSMQGVAVQKKGESSMVTMEAAIEFIENNAGEAPFFAYVCFGSPHHPHIASEQDKMPYLYLDEKFQNFYGELTGMDRAIGILREKLREMGIEDNTIIWYLSDNGGLRDTSTDPDTGERRFLSNTGGRGYKSQIYEGGLRVPGIIEWPGKIKKGRSTNIPFVTSDVYPTLIDIAGLSVEDNEVLDGISLVPLINEELEARDKPIGFWKFPAQGKAVYGDRIMEELMEIQSNGGSVETESLLIDAGKIIKQYSEEDIDGHLAWLSWPFKLHEIYNDKGEIVYELYNLEADPWEQYDLSDQNKNILSLMSDELHQWKLSVISSMNGNDY